MPADEDEKPQRRPGELLKCDLCCQQPESITFNVDECCIDCPFKRPAIRDVPPPASARAA